MARPTLDTDQVVDAAAGIANDEGLDVLTLTRVASDLGVQQPALYRHVDSYDDLMRLLGLKGRELLIERLSAAVVGVAGDDAVRQLGLAWRKVVKEAPGLYAATDRYPCTDDPELEDAVERIVALIATALSSYNLSDLDQVHAARSLRSAFHGFAHLEAGDGHPRPENLDDSFEHLIELLCAGLRALPSDSE